MMDSLKFPFRQIGVSYCKSSYPSYNEAHRNECTPDVTRRSAVTRGHPHKNACCEQEAKLPKLQKAVLFGTNIMADERLDN